MRLPPLLIGLLLGILLFAAFRFFTYDPHITHYHANMAVFVNGERVDLTDDKFMEDVEACKPAYITQILPEERTHMHNNNHDVVHVHQPGATWGHFFANIGWTFGEDYLATDTTRYVNSENATLSFILNGEPVRNPFNTLIESEDRLLISFGFQTKEQVQEQFEQVLSDAHVHNEHPDPGACSGASDIGVWERFKRAVLN